MPTSGLFLKLFFITLAANLLTVGLASEKNNLAGPNSSLRSHSGHQAIDGEGRNGVKALYYERQNSANNHIYSYPIKGLKNNTKYRFGAWIKTENVIATGLDRRGASVAMEFRNKTKLVNGTYLKGLTGTNEWTLVEGITTTPHEFERAELYLYLSKESTGKIWICDPFIYEDAPGWSVGLLFPAMQYAIKPGKHKLVFTSFLYGIPEQGNEVAIEITSADNNIKLPRVPILDNRFVTDVEISSTGIYQVHLTLYRANEDQELLKRTLKIRVFDHESSSQTGSVVTIDKRGITRVNGKKNLPVGITTNQMFKYFKKWDNIWRQEDFDNFINSPFNFIMPYDAMRWKTDNLTGIEATEYIMSELHKHGIMVMFSLKDIHPHRWKKWRDHEGTDAVLNAVIKTFRNHPGLLGWYINDEQNLEAYELKIKETTGMLDPYHPTLQTQYNPHNMEQYIGGGDIMSVDGYPFFDKNSNQGIVWSLMNNSRKIFSWNGDMALWGVPQIFSWSTHRESAKPYFPSEEQIRANLLLMAAMGAKGFLFFSYNSLLVEPEGKTFKELWAQTCRHAMMLRELEPWLISDISPTDPAVQVTNGKIETKLFTRDDGKRIIIIAAVGPGKAEVILTIPGAEMKSKYGKTTYQGENQYRFQCQEVDSDILFEE